MTPSPKVQNHPARLARLRQYLAEDGGNPALLTEAADAALEANEPALALAWSIAGEGLQPGEAHWPLVAARAALALRAFEAMEAALLRAEARGAPPWRVAHERCWACWHRGDALGCRDAAAPWLRSPSEARPAMQALWLRSCHLLGDIEAAWAWAAEADLEGDLDLVACGPAGLLAQDAGDFAASSLLAQRALTGDALQPEALLAQAGVHLARGELAEARGLLERLLADRPDEGRGWCTLGLVSLQQRDLAAARAQLLRASELLPGHVGTWLALGWTRLTGGDLPGADVAFQKALALDGNFAESHGAVALLAGLRGEHATAVRHVEIAKRLDRATVTARFAESLLAGRIRGQGDIEKLAAELLEQPGMLEQTLAAEWRDAVSRR